MPKDDAKIFARNNLHINGEINVKSPSTIERLFENIVRKIINPKFDYFEEEDKKMLNFASKKLQGPNEIKGDKKKKKKQGLCTFC